MKAFTACLGSETNTFSPILCGRDAFEGNFYAAPGKHPDHPTLYSGPMMALRRRARESNWEIVEGLSTFATTGGIVARPVYEEYRDAILAQLRRRFRSTSSPSAFMAPWSRTAMRTARATCSGGCAQSWARR